MGESGTGEGRGVMLRFTERGCSMRLVRCAKCNTPVMSSDNVQERLTEERNEYVKQFDDISNRVLSLKENPANYQKVKNLNIKKIAIGHKIGELNKFIKTLKHEHQNADRDRIFKKLLIQELKKNGYTIEDISEIGKRADEESEEANRQYQKLTETIHNEWHNGKGQYDPTARHAIRNVSRQGK